MGAFKMPSQRQLRVGEEIRRVLSDIINRNDWPQGELPCPVTVTQVSMSPDLQSAVAFIMPLGGENREAVLDFLFHMTFFMRKTLGSQMNLRRVPTLKFRIDETFDQAKRIDDLLKR